MGHADSDPANPTTPEGLAEQGLVPVRVSVLKALLTYGFLLQLMNVSLEMQWDEQGGVEMKVGPLDD